MVDKLLIGAMVTTLLANVTCWAAMITEWLVVYHAWCSNGCGISVVHLIKKLYAENEDGGTMTSVAHLSIGFIGPILGTAAALFMALCSGGLSLAGVAPRKTSFIAGLCSIIGVAFIVIVVVGIASLVESGENIVMRYGLGVVLYVVTLLPADRAASLWFSIRGRHHRHGTPHVATEVGESSRVKKTTALNEESPPVVGDGQDPPTVTRSTAHPYIQYMKSAAVDHIASVKL